MSKTCRKNLIARRQQRTAPSQILGEDAPDSILNKSKEKLFIFREQKKYVRCPFQDEVLEWCPAVPVSLILLPQHHCNCKKRRRLVLFYENMMFFNAFLHSLHNFMGSCITLFTLFFLSFFC